MFKKGQKPPRGTTATAKRVRKPIPTWNAPADFKPFFCEIFLRTDKDGLLSPDIKAIHYTGRYDRNCDDRKKFVMNDYDIRTCMGILSRFSMRTFHTNPTKRLAPNKVYHIVLRVGVKKATGELNILIKEIGVVKKFKSGKNKLEVLDKADPQAKLFKKAKPILGSAFSKVLMPPKRTRKSTKAEE